MLLASVFSNAAKNDNSAITNSNGTFKGQETEDSIFVNLNEVQVCKSLRENSFIGRIPVSSSIVSGEKLESLEASNLRSLSAYIPNLYIPDYGSNLTSAIYIRGIGTRLNTSAVGLYVDNVPYLDKSAFDFELQDVQRVEVLRGPQGTLYGRNSVGGIIHIHTKSPFESLGTTARLSYGSYNDMKVQVSNGRLLSPDMALSLTVNYSRNDGFFKNEFNNENCGTKQSAGGLLKFAGRFADGWKADANLDYEYCDQQGYPYASYSTGKRVISYNDPCSYKRNLMSTSLLLEKECESSVFSSMTGYQWLDDNLLLDQDFSPASIFTLNQKQRQNAVTQEFVIKSREKNSWEWVNGLFGFFRDMRTDSPVHFKTDGVSMLEGSINAGIPSTLNLSVDLTDPDIAIPGLFTEKNISGALYHQSEYHFKSLKGLSAIAGLRLDYEKVTLDYASSALMNVSYLMTRGSMSISDNLAVNAVLKGKNYEDFLNLIPKFSLQYEFNGRNMVYATVSRGFQAGGYNVQLFSDLIQKELQAEMTSQMKTSMAGQLQKYVSMGMPQSAVDAAVARIPVSKGVEDVGAAISYKPEFSWNYEAGFHSEPIKDKLQIDGALFFINTKDRQIALFSPSGYGRMMKNATGSISKGLELSVIAKPVKNLGLNASYGFTKATFTDYKDSARIGASYQEIDYSGKYVPMVPKNTFSAGADYTFNVVCKMLDKICLSAQYHAAGPIYWTESNDIKQDFYGITDAQLSFFKNDMRFDFWIKNAFDTRYDAFYFSSMGSNFAQQGRPMQIGFTTKLTF